MSPPLSTTNLVLEHSTLTTIADIAQLLESFAPVTLAEEWDNVGLLVGDRARPARRVMTCLTLTENVAEEALEREADLVVTHHPLPFRPLHRLTTDTTEGRILWRLARGGVSVYSPHTALDSAAEGINQQLASGLQLVEITPLLTETTQAADPRLGAGRCGAVLQPTTLARLAGNVRKLLDIDHVRVVGDDQHQVRRVAVACGAGGSLLDAAIDQGADAVVTGEMTFHTLLAAEAAGVAMVLTGHYASERFALEWLAGWLAGACDGVEVWASTSEHDPIRLLGN